VVKDTSGAVLPGVSVEAASPALIEKVRSVVTDGEGRYNIVELRPGTYRVTLHPEHPGPLRRDFRHRDNLPPRGIVAKDRWLFTCFRSVVNSASRVGHAQEVHTSFLRAMRTFMSRRLTRWLAVGVFASAMAVAVSGFVVAQRGSQKGEWRAYAGDSYSQKYSPLDQITKDNVQDLRVIWRWPLPDRELSRGNPVLATVRNESTPLMANGVLYHVTGLGQVAAVDPGTGQTRWVYDPEGWKAGRPNNGGFMQRGMGYWTDGKVERLLVGTHDMYLISIDAKTGKPDPTFGDRGRADLTVETRNAVRSTIISSRSPLVAGNVVVVGSSIMDVGGGPNTPPGYVHAFDVRTGKRVWTFHTVPKAGEFGYDSWLNGSAEFNGAANVWGGMAYDPELDYLYMPTSTPSSDYLGVNRPGNNLFAESLGCAKRREIFSRSVSRRNSRLRLRCNRCVGLASMQQYCFPTSSCVSKPRRSSAYCISMRCITVCGTTTFPRIPSSATSRSTAGGSKPSCR
jgi:hypothetical protein